MLNLLIGSESFRVGVLFDITSSDMAGDSKSVSTRLHPLRGFVCIELASEYFGQSLIVIRVPVSLLMKVLCLYQELPSLAKIDARQQHHIHNRNKNEP